ncbi:OmpA/MotB family protein [Portibacter lacus]|uniref:Flagellar motor protein MotB n=1 Tax=Portibacter lacus TaxID=1099794 RepID=A0AA37SNZ2_9BACT|nr:OmpA family protein [Portibacter lacus]GLR16098.1 flagellar motor protein MotB [Portibacter lacus]
MKQLHILILIVVIAIATSCKRKTRGQLEKELAIKTEQADLYKDQLDNLQGTNASLLDRMSELSIVSKTGAENISKSLENISQQYSFIENLSTKIQTKDSINLALVMNLKRSLNNINDEDVKVEVRGGIVNISISDKLLFNSASATINSSAESVLEKIASVINDHYELDVMVEGHTDNVPISNSKYKDNWDLSVNRATAVVRILASKYGVTPERLVAAGRGDNMPKESNDTATGRSANRRTEIIIAPKLDQFFQLLESPEFKG